MGGDRLGDVLLNFRQLAERQCREIVISHWCVPGLECSGKPDWTKHAKAAPFKRNDAMLDVLPVGVLVFPGTGIQENLADKAKKLGIPVMKFEKGA